MEETILSRFGGVVSPSTRQSVCYGLLFRGWARYGTTIRGQLDRIKSAFSPRGETQTQLMIKRDSIGERERGGQEGKRSIAQDRGKKEEKDHEGKPIIDAKEVIRQHRSVLASFRN